MNGRGHVTHKENHAVDKHTELELLWCPGPRLWDAPGPRLCDGSWEITLCLETLKINSQDCFSKSMMRSKQVTVRNFITNKSDSLKIISNTQVYVKIVFQYFLKIEQNNEIKNTNFAATCKYLCFTDSVILYFKKWEIVQISSLDSGLRLRRKQYFITTSRGTGHTIYFFKLRIQALS